MALSTSRIRLGTTVTPVPRRLPWLLARETANLDQLSNGRLVMGVGLGVDEEYEHFGQGMSLRQWAERLDESLGIIVYEPLCGSGESEWDLHLRAGRVAQALVRRGPGRTLVVAHGGILNATLRAIFNVPLLINGAGAWLSFGDAGYARLRYNPADHSCVMLALSQGEG